LVDGPEASQLEGYLLISNAPMRLHLRSLSNPPIGRRKMNAIDFSYADFQFIQLTVGQFVG
jgi:hypothetical protein